MKAFASSNKVSSRFERFKTINHGIQNSLYTKEYLDSLSPDKQTEILSKIDTVQKYYDKNKSLIKYSVTISLDFELTEILDHIESLISQLNDSVVGRYLENKSLQAFNDQYRTLTIAEHKIFKEKFIRVNDYKFYFKIHRNIGIFTEYSARLVDVKYDTSKITHVTYVDGKRGSKIDILFKMQPDTYQPLYVEKSANILDDI